MVWLQTPPSKYAAIGVFSAVLGFLVAWPVLGSAQDKNQTPLDPSKSSAPADPNKDLVEQIKQLSAKVARLEAAVTKIAPLTGGMPAMGGAAGAPGSDMGQDKMVGKGMGMMDADEMMEMMKMMEMTQMKMKKMMGGMAGMKDDAMGGMGGSKKGMSGGGAMGGMKDDAMGGMGMKDDDMDMMGMMGMGSMGGAKGKKMRMATALPGFPGASHIYHIGATDFFLDHPEHITLSTEQKTKLGQMKQKATTEKASGQRKIEEAEQQLWELTAADQPDAAKIDAKVREVEKLRGDQRLAFIRTVGEAAQVLTDDQRKILTGQAQPAAAPPHVHPKTP